MRSPVFRRNQHGAIAIEFAVLFSVFFAVLYAIIAYSIPLLLLLTFKQVAADAARATIAVDPAAENATYKGNLESQVLTVIGRSWIANTKWYAPCSSNTDDAAAGDGDGDGDNYSKLTKDRTLTVCIRYVSDNYNDNPIVPTLTLPIVGQIPRLPELIEGRSTIRL